MTGGPRKLPATPDVHARAKWALGQEWRSTDTIQPVTLDPEAPDVLHIKAPNKVTFAKIGAVLARLEPSLRAKEPGETRKALLDMTSVAFCSPTGITILAAALEHLFSRGTLTGGEIWMPRSPLLNQYLQRMDFFKELKVTMPPESFERPGLPATNLGCVSG